MALVLRATKGSELTWEEMDGNLQELEERFTAPEVYTVATLPTAGVPGRQAIVSDALSPIMGVAVVGGGAVTVPVFDTGAAWLVLGAVNSLQLELVESVVVSDPVSIFLFDIDLNANYLMRIEDLEITGPLNTHAPRIGWWNATNSGTGTGLNRTLANSGGTSTQYGDNYTDSLTAFLGFTNFGPHLTAINWAEVVFINRGEAATAEFYGRFHGTNSTPATTFTEVHHVVPGLGFDANTPQITLRYSNPSANVFTAGTVSLYKIHGEFI